MDDEDRPLGSGGKRMDAAHALIGESLDGYSLDELDHRVDLLAAEIERVKALRQSASAHRLAAEALFQPRRS